MQHPSRCCHIDKTSFFIAVGSNSGGLTIYFLSDRADRTNTALFKLDELAYRKDSKAECTDVKFSPSNDMIALGSRDDCVYLYSVAFDVGDQQARQLSTSAGCVLKALRKLKGHSSTISHIGSFGYLLLVDFEVTFVAAAAIVVDDVLLLADVIAIARC